MTIPDGLDLPGSETERQQTGSGEIPRYTRRLSDKLLVAFHHACDQPDFEVAERLLGVLEMMLKRNPPVQGKHLGRELEILVAAHERLWQLRHRTGNPVE